MNDGRECIVIVASLSRLVAAIANHSGKVIYWATHVYTYVCTTKLNPPVPEDSIEQASLVCLY